MIIPVRCFSCGKPLGHLWEDFNQRTKKKGESVKKVLDEMGLDRYCCRATLMGHIDIIDTASQFKKY